MIHKKHTLSTASFSSGVTRNSTGPPGGPPAPPCSAASINDLFENKKDKNLTFV